MKQQKSIIFDRGQPYKIPSIDQNCNTINFKFNLVYQFEGWIMWCKSFARTEQMHVDAKEKEKYGFNESYYICNAQFLAARTCFLGFKCELN